jgi:hypothetical protein
MGLAALLGALASGRLSGAGERRQEVLAPAPATRAAETMHNRRNGVTGAGFSPSRPAPHPGRQAARQKIVAKSVRIQRNGVTVRIQLTHLFTYPLEGGDGERDAVGAAGEARFFVPGRLPCASCSLCRRGLVAACPTALVLLPSPEPATLEVPDRFLTPLDDPAVGLPDAIPAELAAGAGLVALAVQAAAAASLTPGDVAIWLGGGLLGEVGAQLSAGRGARSFLLGEAATLPAEKVERVASLCDLLTRLDQDPPAEGAAHQRSTRRLFLTRTEPATLAAATRLADTGAAVVSIGRGPAELTGLSLPPEARLSRVTGYHPDLVPEALALLRRRELSLPPGLPWPGLPWLSGPG